MHSKFVYIICCIYLLLVGAIFGRFINTFDIDLDHLTKIFSMLASITTVFGVLAAFISLNVWKSEYKNKKLDSLLDDLEDNFEVLYKSSIEYYFAKTDLIKKENHRIDSEKIMLSKEKESNKLEVYLKDEAKYSSVYDKLSRHHQLDTNSIINPKVINKENTAIIQFLYEIHAPENLRVVNELQLKHFEDLRKIREACKNEYRALREKILITS